MLDNTVLSDGLDEHAATLARDGRVTIPRLLQPDVADRLYEELSAQLPWRLAYRDTRVTGANQQQLMTREMFAAMGPAKVQALQTQVLTQARDHFQYLYHHFDLAGGRLRDDPPGLLLYALLTHMESEPFMERMRAMTGTAELDEIYAHATLYAAGNFLKIHEDVSHDDDRRYAFVLGFTRDWDVDMGGLLHFLDESGGVTETLVPSFNTLTLFAVPTPHLVSVVAPWVTRMRLAITGWLKVRADRRAQLA